MVVGHVTRRGWNRLLGQPDPCADDRRTRDQRVRPPRLTHLQRSKGPAGAGPFERCRWCQSPRTRNVNEPSPLPVLVAVKPTARSDSRKDLASPWTSPLTRASTLSRSTKSVAVALLTSPTATLKVSLSPSLPPDLRSSA